MSTVVCKPYSIETSLEKSFSLIKDLILFGKFEAKKSRKPIEFNNLDEEKNVLLERLDNLNNLVNFFHENAELEYLEEIKDISVTRELLQSISNDSKKANVLASELKARFDSYNLLDEEEIGLTHNLKILEPYKSVKNDILGQFEFIKTLFVEITNLKKVEEILTKLQSKFKDTIIIKHTKETKKSTFFYILALKTNTKLSKFLAKYSEIVVHDGSSITNNIISPNKEFINLAKKIKKAIDEKNRIKLSLIKDIRANYSQILGLQAILSVELEAIENLDTIAVFNSSLNEIEENNGNFLENSKIKTGLSLNTIVHIDGWMDESYKSELNYRLKKIKGSQLIEAKPNFMKKFGSRIALKNNPILKPFEFITKVMGMPTLSETDPSPFISFFFVLYFGFAIGDAAYGLIFLAIGIYLATKAKSTNQMMEYSQLVIYSAISTFIFGVITGSWFGLNLGEMNNPIASFLLSFKLFDFGEAVIPILLASIGIGLIQQSLGMFLSVYNSYKDGKLLDGLAKTGTWFLLLASLIFFGLTGAVSGLSNFATLAQILVWISLLLFVIGQSKGTKNIFLKPFVGLANLFNITGYFSNTLSYARLLPLGLATAVISSVVNLLALTFGSLELGFGLIIFLIIFLVGHTFNIVISTMGGAINVLRLQLVEFLPLFFSGDGVELSPLKLNLFQNKSGINHQLRPDLTADLINRNILE